MQMLMKEVEESTEYEEFKERSQEERNGEK
jgi:hypothetical protein